MTKLRRTEIFKDGRWSTGVFKDLKKGDTFRMFEPTGEPVKDGAATDFVALSNAYFCTQLKTHTVQIEPFTEGF